MEECRYSYVHLIRHITPVSPPPPQATNVRVSMHQKSDLTLQASLHTGVKENLFAFGGLWTPICRYFNPLHTYCINYAKCNMIPNFKYFSLNSQQTHLTLHVSYPCIYIFPLAGNPTAPPPPPHRLKTDIIPTLLVLEVQDNFWGWFVKNRTCRRLHGTYIIFNFFSGLKSVKIIVLAFYANWCATWSTIKKKTQ
jgi:hypothetical protein